MNQVILISPSYNGYVMANDIVLHVRVDRRIDAFLKRKQAQYREASGGSNYAVGSIIRGLLEFWEFLNQIYSSAIIL